MIQLKGEKISSNDIIAILHRQIKLIIDTGQEKNVKRVQTKGYNFHQVKKVARSVKRCFFLLCVSSGNSPEVSIKRMRKTGLLFGMMQNIRFKGKFLLDEQIHVKSKKQQESFGILFAAKKKSSKKQQKFASLFASHDFFRLVEISLNMNTERNAKGLKQLTKKRCSRISYLIRFFGSSKNSSDTV